MHEAAPPALHPVQVVAVAPFLKLPSAHSEQAELVHDLQFPAHRVQEVIGEPVAYELSTQPEHEAAVVASPA